MNEIFDISCTKCRKQISGAEFEIKIIRDDDLEVKYFLCPHCGASYHVFTSDSTMRALVKKRAALAQKIKAGRAKKFSFQTMERYMRESDAVKKEQMELHRQLKAKGEALLKRKGL